MPKLKTDYNKTIIYKLVKNDDFNNENIYVGSTVDFTSRKHRHMSNCLKETGKEYNTKVYKYIRDNGGWENWSMIEIEKYPCNDKNEAHAREEYWRCQFNALLNSRKALLTTEEKKEQIKQYRIDNADKNKQYYIDNIDEIKNRNKQYRLENESKLKEIKKQYRINNPDKIKHYSKKYYIDNADKIKQYQIDNADKIIKDHKQWLIDNSDKIKEKHKCECGGTYTIYTKKEHFKTKKHTTYFL
jgi:hypothetical protein